MFRLSQYMQELVSPTPVGPRRDLPGPVVIWNLIRSTAIRFRPTPISRANSTPPRCSR